MSRNVWVSVWDLTHDELDRLAADRQAREPEHAAEDPEVQELAALRPSRRSVAGASAGPRVPGQSRTMNDCKLLTVRWLGSLDRLTLYGRAKIAGNLVREKKLGCPRR